MSDDPAKHSRRDLMAGLRSLRTPQTTRTSEVVRTAVPAGGSTLRLTCRAMACDFSVILNPGCTEYIESAGQALEVVPAIEDWMSPYRESSDLSLVNRSSPDQPMPLRDEFLRFLELAETLFRQTGGGFDPATGALTQLWRTCRRESRIPTESEIAERLPRSGFQHVRITRDPPAVTLLKEGVWLDPGAFGKGFALDEAVGWLRAQASSPQDFLMHGGHSSLIAQGGHNSHAGWPVGLGNPLFTEKRLATILLKNQAMGTSGSNIQFFRFQGRRYGHILNPFSGWPVEGILSVTVLAPSAAVADGLSTAFFAMGAEKAVECCRQMADIGLILIPQPERGVRLKPVIIGIPEEQIWWDEGQVQWD